jgi:hypothetical protein
MPRRLFCFRRQESSARVGALYFEITNCDFNAKGGRCYREKAANF